MIPDAKQVSMHLGSDRCLCLKYGVRRARIRGCAGSDACVQVLNVELKCEQGGGVCTHFCTHFKLHASTLPGRRALWEQYGWTSRMRESTRHARASAKRFAHGVGADEGPYRRYCCFRRPAALRRRRFRRFVTN